MPHDWKIFLTREIKAAWDNGWERWECWEREPDIAAVFDDLGYEVIFDGFEGGHRDYNRDSDVDLVGLEDDGGGPAPGRTDDEEEEAR